MIDIDLDIKNHLDKTDDTVLYLREQGNEKAVFIKSNYIKLNSAILNVVAQDVEFRYVLMNVLLNFLSQVDEEEFRIFKNAYKDMKKRRKDEF